jgi:hypothetical protein
MRAAFILAAECKSIALRSRSFIPAYVNPASNDKRRFGVAVSCLQIDDSQLSLETTPHWQRVGIGASGVAMVIVDVGRRVVRLCRRGHVSSSLT